MNKHAGHTSRMDVISLVVLVVVTAFTALYMKGLNGGIPYYYDSIGYSATIGGTFVAAFALATNVMTVAVMSTASRKHMGRRVGIKGAGTPLGTMFGAVVATGLLDGIGFQGFFGFYVALMLVAMLMVFLLKRAERASARERPLLPEKPHAALARDDALRGAQVYAHGLFVAVTCLEKCVVRGKKQPFRLVTPLLRQL